MQITTRSYTKFALLFATATISFKMLSEDFIPKPPACEVPGMIGECPSDACYIIKCLKEENEKLKQGITHTDVRFGGNVLIIEGPSGTGKTKLAQEIANNTGRTLVAIQDGGAHLLYSCKPTVNQNLKKDLVSMVCEQKPVIILIDNFSPSLSSEHISACKMLAHRIEENKNNLNIFFIFTTTSAYGVPAALKDRATTIKMTNPDSEQRKKFFNHLSSLYTKKNLTDYCCDDCINHLINKTEYCNAHDIEKIYSLAQKYASYEDGKIAQKHLMYALKEVCATKEAQ